MQPSLVVCRDCSDRRVSESYQDNRVLPARPVLRRIGGLTHSFAAGLTVEGVSVNVISIAPGPSSVAMTA